MIETSVKLQAFKYRRGSRCVFPPFFLTRFCVIICWQLRVTVIFPLSSAKFYSIARISQVLPNRFRSRSPWWLTPILRWWTGIPQQFIPVQTFGWHRSAVSAWHAACGFGGTAGNEVCLLALVLRGDHLGLMEYWGECEPGKNKPPVYCVDRVASCLRVNKHYFRGSPPNWYGLLILGWNYPKLAILMRQCSNATEFFGVSYFETIIDNQIELVNLGIPWFIVLSHHPTQSTKINPWHNCYMRYSSLLPDASSQSSCWLGAWLVM